MYNLVKNNYIRILEKMKIKKYTRSYHDNKEGLKKSSGGLSHLSLPIADTVFLNSFVEGKGKGEGEWV